MYRTDLVSSDVLLENDGREAKWWTHEGVVGRKNQAGDSKPSYGYSRREAADHVTISPRVLPWRTTFLPLERSLKKALRPITP